MHRGFPDGDYRSNQAMTGWSWYQGDNTLNRFGPQYDSKVHSDGAKLWPGARRAAANGITTDYPGAVEQSWTAPGGDAHQRGA